MSLAWRVRLAHRKDGRRGAFCLGERWRRPSGDARASRRRTSSPRAHAHTAYLTRPPAADPLRVRPPQRAEQGQCAAPKEGKRDTLALFTTASPAPPAPRPPLAPRPPHALAAFCMRVATPPRLPQGAALCARRPRSEATSRPAAAGSAALGRFERAPAAPLASPQRPRVRPVARRGAGLPGAGASQAAFCAHLAGATDTDRQHAVRRGTGLFLTTGTKSQL